jgi:hypothetical protein
MKEEESELYELSDEVREDLRSSFSPPPFPKERIERRIRRSIGEPTHADAWAGTPELATNDGRDGFGDPAWSRHVGGVVRVALVAAAVLMVFIGGAEYGRRLGPRGSEADRTRAALIASGIDPGAVLPLEIQASGSRYIATLARFSAESEMLPEDQRKMAREVALAVMYSAALELLSEGGEDQVLQSVANLVIERRTSLRDSALMLRPGS